MKKNKNWGLIKFFIIIVVISYIFASFLGLFINQQESGNIAIIKVWGPITLTSSQGLFSENVASSNEIVSLIEKADKNNMIKAIILDINSPGGSPVASDEISLAIKNANKPVISVIREIGASGAYWVASSSDYIFANRMSITGSIGAYSSFLEFSGLFDDYNISYNIIKSGKFKDLGSPFKEMTAEERHLLQQRIDIIHDFFVQEIANNRNLSYEHVDKVADGMFHLGNQALELKLIDELGSIKDALKYIENKLDIKSNPVNYKIRRGFFDSFIGLFNNQRISLNEINEKKIIT